MGASGQQVEGRDLDGLMIECCLPQIRYDLREMEGI